jgi:methylmalonyl-CoA mutase
LTETFGLGQQNFAGTGPLLVALPGPNNYKRAVLFSVKSKIMQANRISWQAAVEKALRGRPLDSLTRRTLDGLVRGPLRTATENPVSSTPGGKMPTCRGIIAQNHRFQPWDIRQTVQVTDAKSTNQRILQELAGGCSSVQLEIGPNCEITAADQLPTLFHDVDLKIVRIGIQSNAHTSDFVGLFPNAPNEMGDLPFDFGLAPTGNAIQFQQNPRDQTKETEQIMQWARVEAPNARCLAANATFIHNTGASEAMELAWLGAEAIASMKWLMDAGLNADQAAGQLVGHLAMDADLHLGICKLRAARRIWAQIMQAFGVSEPARLPVLHTHTSRRMLSRRDPWVNILRASSAAFASVLGGTQIHTIAPFTESLGQAPEMATRLARNTQLVLLEECAAGRVVDPAGGSHAHEAMTRDLADKAWNFVQQIEARGGLWEAATCGWLSEQMAPQREARLKRLRTRKTPLIGISEFANLQEVLPEVKPHLSQDTTNTLFPIFRNAAEFEALRDRADNSQSTQEVFLATFGSLSHSAPRSGFARKLLAAGGIGSTEAVVWTDEAAMIRDYQQSGTALAILCGTDADYASNAEDWAKALKSVGAKQVWIAGGPALPDGSAIDRRIAMGCDAIAALEQAQACLGFSK